MEGTPKGRKQTVRKVFQRWKAVIAVGTVSIVIMAAIILLKGAITDEGASRDNILARSKQSEYYIPKSSPFDGLIFSNFLYEEGHKGKTKTNAHISGNVYNQNSYSVSGYFYVIFYKNGSVVHRELVGLGTVPAYSQGTWSDIIYGVDMMR